MANPDPAKIAAESYAKATDAYAKNQTAQGMAAAKMADTAEKQAAPAIPGAYPAGEKGAAPPKADSFVQEGYGSTPNTQAKAMANAGLVPDTGKDPLAGRVYQNAGGMSIPVLKSDMNYEGFERNREKALPAGDPSFLTGPMIQAMPNPYATATPEKTAETDKFVNRAEDNQMPLPDGTPAPTEAPIGTKAEAKKQSAIDKIIEGMKSETSKEGGPNVWDIIQAAAAGWNFQTPAYLERKKAKEAKAADIEKLSKTAQFEKALQEERLAAEGERSKADIASRERIAGLGGVGTLPGATKGQTLGAGLLQGIKGK